jgi:hypothetical protein
MAINKAHPNFAIIPSKTLLADDASSTASWENHPLPISHYDGYETDPPSHYPKPGHGLARTLPPETNDLPWLLDDNNQVFSSTVFSDAVALVPSSSVLGVKVAEDKRDVAMEETTNDVLPGRLSPSLPAVETYREPSALSTSALGETTVANNEADVAMDELPDILLAPLASRLVKQHLM